MNEGKDRKGPVPLGAVVTVRATPAASPSPSSASPSPAASPAPGAASPAPAASPSPEGESDEKKTAEGRVTAIGDADFASNQLLAFQGNQDFLLNVVAWLAQDADLISIRPKEPDDQRLVLTRNQQQNMLVLALLLIPGVFVVMGIREWWSRR